MYTSVSLDTLRVGATLHSCIHDPQNASTKLLGAGVEITAAFLKRLSERGIRTVIVDNTDLARLNAYKPQGAATTAPLAHDYVQSLLTTDDSEQLDAALEHPDTLRVDDGYEPFADQLEEKPAGPFDTGESRDFQQMHDRSMAYVEGLFSGLVTGQPSDADDLQNVCSESLKFVLRDPDLFTCLGINPYSTDYPCRHSLHVATLAISIGVNVGLDRPSLIDLGIGCLLHDCSMLQLDKRLYNSKRRLTSAEIARVADHPVFTLNLLSQLGRDLPMRARLIAYQMHERCNGSGYPRGHVAQLIHPLAKIAAVADAYVALVTDRPSRPAMQPYFAIEKMLHDVRAGLFEADAVRGLLRTVSLLPIGSFVAVTGDYVGRVLRSNGDHYDRPTVEMWKQDKGTDDHADVVNLAVERDLSIIVERCVVLDDFPNVVHRRLVSGTVQYLVQMGVEDVMHFFRHDRVRTFQ